MDQEMGMQLRVAAVRPKRRAAEAVTAEVGGLGAAKGESTGGAVGGAVHAPIGVGEDGAAGAAGLDGFGTGEEPGAGFMGGALVWGGAWCEFYSVFLGARKGLCLRGGWRGMVKGGGLSCRGARSR